jgi:hypothetical protein
MVRINIDTGSLQLDTNGNQGVVTKNFGNPFDCVVMFTKPYRRFREVSLKNVQIPIGFYNVRAPYNSIIINGTTYTVSPGNYSAATFLAALNIAVPSSVGVFSIGASTNIFQFAPASGSATITTTPVSTSRPSLGSLLGFTNGQVASFPNSITAPYSYIMNFDTYVNIYIEKLGASSPEAYKSTFKIPNNVTSGGILYWAENSQDSQIVQVTDSSNRVDRLIIKVTDRFGEPLNNNGIDWSFSLEVDCDL